MEAMNDLLMLLQHLFDDMIFGLAAIFFFGQGKLLKKRRRF